MFKRLTMNRLQFWLTTLWGLDIVFTLIFVNIGGLELEANPIIRLVFEHLGSIGFVIVKMVCIAGFCYYTSLTNRSWVKYVSIGLNLIMLYVAILGALTVAVSLGIHP